MKKVLLVLMLLSCVFFSFASASDIEDLEKIVVTSTRIGQSDYKITGNVTIIDKNDIANSNAKSIPDVLKETLGINVYDNSSSKTSKLDIRGFGETAASSVLFLVNDRKTNSIDMSGADLLQIPIEAVEKIEIIRGAGSVLYGDNAVGGVVNIITKKGKGDISGKAGVTYGSYDRNSTDVELSGSKQGVSYYIFSKYNNEKGFRDNSDLLAKDYNMRLGYDFSEKIKLDLEAGLHEDKYGTPGSLTYDQMNTLSRRGATNLEDWASTRDSFINFSFDINPWPEDLYFGKLVVDFNIRHRNAYTDNVAWSSDTKNSIDTKGINAKYIFDKTIFGKKVDFVTGIDYYDNENDLVREAASKTEITISKEEFGVYGFLEYEVLDNWFANAGTRFHKANYDFNQKDGTDNLEQNPDEWVSMAGLKYEYAKGSNLFFNVQQTFRFLATDEWFNSITGVLNSDLKQQTGIQYEMGLKHNINDKVTLSVTPYWIDVKNEIYYNPNGGNFGWGANENYDNTRRIGVELGSRFNILNIFDLAFLDRCEFFANYTYQNPQFADGAYDGKDVPLVARHQAQSGLTVGFFDNFNVSLLGRFIGSRFVGSDTSNALSPLKPYYVVDGKIAYNNNNLEVYAEVNNIFEEQYSTYVTSYGTTKYFYPAEEKNFNVGMKLKF